MGRQAEYIKIDEATRKQLIQKADSSWKSAFGFPVPSSGIYVERRHFVSWKLNSKIDSQTFLDCVEKHVKRSAESSKDLVKNSLEIVQKVMDKLLPSLKISADGQNGSFASGEYRLVQGKTKKLTVGAYAYLEYPYPKGSSGDAEGFAAEVLFIVWEAEIKKPTQKEIEEIFSGTEG